MERWPPWLGLGNGKVWISLRYTDHDLDKEVWEKIKYEYDEQTKTIVGKLLGHLSSFRFGLRGP